jgi:hypothetical protein
MCIAGMDSRQAATKIILIQGIGGRLNELGLDSAGAIIAAGTMALTLNLLFHRAGPALDGQ